jgi:hypothetical protein
MSEPATTGPSTAPNTVEPPPAAAEAKPAPPPLTPERVLAWNRYIDRYVVGFVMVLVLIASLRPISQSAIWGLLRSGDAILSGAPITTDSLSFSRQGQRWVNIPWLYEVASSSLYHGVERVLQSPDYPDRGAQAGASALVILNALLVTMAAAALLTIRHAGPGLWWTAICVFLAVGGIVVPSGRGLMPSVGGLAFGKNPVEPESWGLVLLAIELVVLFRGSVLGQRRVLWSLPLVFVLWANIAANFAFGLCILAAWSIGQSVAWAMGHKDPKVASSPPGSPILPLAVLAVSVLACLANPSTFWVFPTAFKPIVEIVPRWTGHTTNLLFDEVGFVDRLSRDYFNRTGGPGTANAFLLFYIMVVLAVLASFALNWRRFSLPRFLMFGVSAVIWAGLIRLAPAFSLVFAATLALNGQEWFQDVFGTDGRTGRTWKWFSDGGRAVTIVLVCAFIGFAVTGYKSVEGDTFGLGYDESKLAFETADFARDSGIEGQILGLTRSFGDVFLWRDPHHPPYIDNRHGLYADTLQAELEALRIALRKDDKQTWSRLLDQYARDGRPVSAVMVPPEFGGIYRSLMKSPDWIPIHDGGNAIIFGRADLPDLPDLARFEALRLDPETLVYQGRKALSGPDRPPTASTWMDGILQYRALKPTQPRVDSGGRWLVNPADPEAPLVPARCLLAIRDARLALIKNPDDSAAYELLSQAYGALGALEARILGQTQTASGSIPPAFTLFRYRQRVAALNFAIATAAPPNNNPAAATRLATLHREIAGLYDNNNAFDLERTHLDAARQLLGSSFPEVLQQQLTRLDEQYNQFQDQLSDFAAANSAGPVQQANLASQRGYPAMAIGFLLDAENAGFNLAQLRYALVDLYCQTGQPDKAFDLLEGTTANDESLGLDGSSPGLKMARAGYRNGLVNLLIGNYPIAASYWGVYTLPFIRSTESQQTISAAREMLRGQPVPALRAILEVSGTPEQPGLIDTYAEWETELGLCQLEAGMALDRLDAAGAVVQEGAATRFLRALEIKPRSPLRPLLVYYLEKMGVDVPPLPPGEAPTTPAPAREGLPADTAPDTAPGQEAPAAGEAPSEPAAVPAPDTKPAEPPTPADPKPNAPSQPQAEPEPADSPKTAWLDRSDSCV